MNKGLGIVRTTGLFMIRGDENKRNIVGEVFYGLY